jgi:hypothetical protein
MPKIIARPSHYLSLLILLLLALITLLPETALAHNVARGDQSFLEENSGANIIPYMYLGAKHMVTGYDHLLYLAGIIFFLFRIRDVAVFVSLFALGHSITLLTGVLAGWQVNPYLVDAIIGLSVAYKAFENLGGFSTFFSVWINTRVAVFCFGLVHGLGLSSKLQDMDIAREGLVSNIISFNIGVELGQLVALTFLVLAFNLLRQSSQFQRNAVFANVLLMAAGFLLMTYQFTGYVVFGEG